MSWLSNLSIKTKILVIPAVAIAGFLLSLAFNANVNASNAERLQSIRSVFFPVVQSSKSNLVRLDRIVETLNSAVSSGEEEMIQSADNIYQEMQKGFSRQAKLWPEGSQGVVELEQQASRYFNVAKKLSDGMIQGSVDPSHMSGMIEEMNTSLHALQKGLKEYSTNAEKSFNAVVLAADKASSDGLKTGFFISLVTIVIIGVTAYSIAHMITKNIGSMISSLKDIAQGEGDLTQRIEVSSADELGEMVKWFNLFVDKLHHSIGDVVKAINPLATLSSDLGAITSRTSQLTDQQSNATEQVTHAVDDMFVSVQEVARHASSAAEAAADADRESKEGRNVVEQTVDSINDLAQNVEKAGTVIRQLEEDTEGVGSILAVIKGIAEQTNLLALNAAIEAARAGEQGRGFAVVADEVRTLASRTQDSTQEIQKVIEQLQSAAQSAVSVMDDGQEGAKISVEKAAQTGQSLQAITERVEAISQMNIQIADATEQQENASNSIKSNVVGIKENALTAVDNVKEVEIASESLVAVAETLRGITNQFKV